MAFSVIRVDHREKGAGVVEYLKKSKIAYETVNNQATDYIINDIYGIERKTIQDFFASVRDGRIFSQAVRLGGGFAYPLIILEGGGLYLRAGEFHPNTIRGVFLWLSLGPKVPVLRTCHQSDTARFLALLARRRRPYRGPARTPEPAPTRPRSLFDIRLRLLTAIPGIGPALAYRLIKRFPTPADLIAADQQKIAATPGIGPKKAALIKKVLLNNNLN